MEANAKHIVSVAEVTNELFLQTIFGDQSAFSHVTSFTQDPNNIPSSQSGICWGGGYYESTKLLPCSNQFYTVSLFKPDDLGKANRRKVNFKACYVVALDDVKEKLPLDKVELLPPPSIVINSSLYSEQWLYLLETPCTDSNKIDNLHDGLITNGLAPDGRDPGQKGVTRYLRLPEGFNTKAKRIEENNGTAPQCNVTQWHPERRYTLEELAKPFSVDIHTPRVEKRLDGASDISDHPLIQTNSIEIKRTVSSGRYDIVCPWLDEHTGADDSGSAMFTNDDGSIGFKCHHGSCEARTGSDLIAIIEEYEPGFSSRLKNWKTIREFDCVEVETVKAPPSSTNSPLELLRLMSANGDSKKMIEKMNDDVFVLEGLAILGQWTVFYAAPGTGKTLLIQYLLKETITNRKIQGANVFYINCDDTYKGSTEKLEMAEKYGYQMLLPNVKDFKPSATIGIMQSFAESNEANGVVLIIDTLKKLVDLMDKKTSTSFGKVAREFVGVGGTLICLAHVNKHKSADGKSVYTGTADIRDDADCVFMIEHLASNKALDGSETHTVEFECTKSRGDVSQSIAFQYTKTKGAGYHSMFGSVQRINGDAVETAKQKEDANRKCKSDNDAIILVEQAIKTGIKSKGGIVEFMSKESAISRRDATKLLNEYEDRFWVVTKAEKNTSSYSLFKSPLPEVSFL